MTRAQTAQHQMWEGGGSPHILHDALVNSGLQLAGIYTIQSQILLQGMTHSPAAGRVLCRQSPAVSSFRPCINFREPLCSRPCSSQSHLHLAQCRTLSWSILAPEPPVSFLRHSQTCVNACLHSLSSSAFFLFLSQVLMPNKCFSPQTLS